jgi:hypothetical protein
MQDARPQLTSMSPCDVAALQKCLKENKGDHKKVSFHEIMSRSDANAKIAKCKLFIP